MDLKSMTGYGRACQIRSGREIRAEIKSVNNRFLDLQVKTPRFCSFCEEKLRSLAGKYISRGKCEFSLHITNIEAAETKITANKAVIADYVNAARESGAMANDGGVTLGDLLKIPDAFVTVRAETDESALPADILAVAEEAFAAFNLSRENEGKNLEADLRARIDAIEENLARIEEIAPAAREDYYNRLADKMRQVVGDRAAGKIDEARLLTEAAIFAEHVAIDEETVRLASHIGTFRKILENGGVCGKNIDFLLQEMGRETNTIGSKAQNIDITRRVLTIKSELEKLREQTANVQ